MRTVLNLNKYPGRPGEHHTLNNLSYCYYYIKWYYLMWNNSLFSVPLHLKSTLSKLESGECRALNNKNKILIKSNFKL